MKDCTVLRKEELILKYDVIIIGMGIAGISAAVYAKQANYKVLLLEGSAPGGLLNNIDRVTNYAGINNITGPDFAMNLFNQVNINEIEYILEEVVSINVNEDIKEVKTTSKIYTSKNVIIATGRTPKLLGLAKEEEFLGRGISTCAVCDASFYKNCDVAVVGSGNSALQESLYLSKIVNKVHLIMRRKSFAVETELVEKIKNTKNIDMHFQTYIENLIIEENKIKGVSLNNGELEVNGVFIYAGYKPSTKFLSNLDILDKNGYVEVNDQLETSIKGIYAIGDVIKKDIYQLVSAASDGARVVSKLKI